MSEENTLPHVYKVVTKVQDINLIKIGSNDAIVQGIAKKMPESIWRYLSIPTTATRRVAQSLLGKDFKKVTDLPDFGVGYLSFIQQALPQLSGFNPRMMDYKYKVCTLVFDPLKHQQSSTDKKLEDFRKGVQWLADFLATEPYKSVTGDCTVYALRLNHILEEVPPNVDR